MRNRKNVKRNMTPAQVSIARRKAASGTRAMVKKASSAYDIASRAAEMITYDGWEDASEALYSAIDDELIYTADMMEVIQEYGDTSEIWRAFTESSGFDDFMDACWSEFADLVPDGYDDWEDYINNSFDEGDVMDALAEVDNDELAEMEDYDERWDYLMDIAIDATGKSIDTMSGSYDAISDLVNGRLKELGFTASRRKMMYRKPRIYAHKPIRHVCRYRR